MVNVPTWTIERQGQPAERVDVLREERAQSEPHRESVVGLLRGLAEEFGGASQAGAEGVGVPAHAGRGFGIMTDPHGDDRGAQT